MKKFLTLLLFSSCTLLPGFAFAQAVDFLASVDSASATGKVLLGRSEGASSGNVSLVLNNIPAYLIGSNTVHVLTERIPDNGTSALGSLTTVINSDYTVSSSSITVTLASMGATDGYAITLTPGTGGSPPSPLSTTETVTINMALDGGPVKYKASGFLHSAFLSTTPSDAFVTPVKPKLIRCAESALAGVANVCAALYARAKTLGAEVQVIVSDHIYSAPWPGDGGNWTSWETRCASKVNAAVAAGRTYQWDIWNEPNFATFWGSAGGQAQWFEAYRRCVNVIRGILPGATIVGPSIGPYDLTWIQQFLSYANTNNVLPNILSWHEFDTSAARGTQIPGNVAAVRAYMVTNGIRIPQIQINEMILEGEMGSSGRTIRYLANIERSEVTGAVHACWADAGTSSGDNCFASTGTLNGLLTTNGTAARSSWWAYKVYGDMSGRLVGFTQVTNGLSPIATGILDNFENGLRVGQPNSVGNLHNMWGFSCACTGDHSIVTTQRHDGTHALESHFISSGDNDWQMHFYTFTETKPGWADGWNLISKFVNNPSMNPAGGTPAWTDKRFNRIKFWIKMPPGVLAPAAAFHNVEFGTFIRCSTCGFAEDGGNHYYHFVTAYYAGGEWQQVIIDEHPDHQRGGAGSSEWPQRPPTTPASTNFTYWDLMTRFYIDMPYSPFLPFDSRVYVDGFEFYEELNPENTEQIRSITAVYVPATNEIRAAWTRRKDQDTVQMQVRYAFSDIFALGFDNATAAPSGTFTPPCCNGNNNVKYSTTGIDVTGQSNLYLAVKPANSSLFRQIVIPTTGTPAVLAPVNFKIQ